MVDYWGVIKAIAFFFFGVVFTAIGFYIVPVFIDVIPADYQWARALGWFSIIIIAFITMIIVPIYHITKATQN